MENKLSGVGTPGMEFQAKKPLLTRADTLALVDTEIRGIPTA